MKRSVGVLLAAIVQLLGSTLMLLMTVLLAVFAFSMGNAHGVREPPLPRAGIGFAIALYGVLTAAGYATAIGVFLRKQWARIVTLIFACFLLFGCAMAALGILIMPMIQPGMPNISDHELHVMRFMMGAIFAIPALIGAWWLWLFTRRSVAAEFAAQPTQPPAGIIGGPPPALSLSARRPVSITVIAVWMLFGVACTPFAFLYVRIPAAAFLFWIISGAAAIAMTVLFGAIYLLIGIGLLRLRPWSRLAAMLWLFFGALNNAVFFCAPGGETRNQRLMELMRTQMRTPAGPPLQLPAGFMIWITVCIALIALLQIYFLITRRAAFEPTGPPSPACQTSQSTK